MICDKENTVETEEIQQNVSRPKKELAQKEEKRKKEIINPVPRHLY